MILASVAWTKENITRYVKYSVMGKKKGGKGFLIAYAVILVLLVAAGVVCSIITNMWAFALLSVLALLLVGGAAIIVKVAMNKYINDILKVNADNKIDNIEINDIGMIVKNGEIPVAVIGWESAASLDFNQNDAYFTTVNGLIFIIEKDKLVQGDFDMLGELAAKRMVKQDDELSA